MTHTQVFKGETFRNVSLKTKQADVDPEGSWSLQGATGEAWHLAFPHPTPPPPTAPPYS